MKKFITLILFLGFTLVGFSQTTLIPNSNFEQALIDLGIDKGTINGSVPTADISGIKSLDVSNYNITDLTGIEDFTALTSLSCDSNQLTSLDVSNNTALTYLNCYDNQLTSLDVRNGNNTNFTSFYSSNNPNLTCIFVDNASYSTKNWTDVDATTTFVNNEAECEALNTNLFQPTTKVELEAAVDGWTASPQTITADSPVPSGQGSGIYGAMNTGMFL
jgi:Leucine-rich repeat (LRR) protein